MEDRNETATDECQCALCGRLHRRLGAPPGNLASLAKLNEHDETARTLERLIANGELSDYDDEIANRVKDAIKIVRGVSALAAKPK